MSFTGLSGWGFSSHCFLHILENKELQTYMKPQNLAFENPPINEVVISTYLNPPISDLRSEHIGLFWQRIKDEFPVVRQQPPVGIRPELSDKEPFPMPRYWFIADDEVNLIQIQKNAFMFNWRRRDHEYPRFHGNIKPAFDHYYSLFSEFIRREIGIAEPSIELCELNYINALEHCEFWAGPQETKTVIPSFSIVAPGINVLGSPDFNCNYAYVVTTDLQININIRSGVKAQQRNVPVLIFEIKAVGRMDQIAEPGTDEWFERAHNAVISCFLGITNQEIQDRFWHPKEDVL